MTLPWSLSPLSPVTNSTIAVTSTTQNVALGATNVNATTVQVFNVGLKEAFIAFGGSSVTVTAQGAVTATNDGGTSIPAGALLSFSAYLPAITHVAAICAAGETTTLRVCRGIGS